MGYFTNCGPYFQLQEFFIHTDQRASSNLMEQPLHTDWHQKALTKLMRLEYKIVYRKGCDNKAVDALSRRPHSQSELLMLSTSQSTWTRETMESYVGDPCMFELIWKLTDDGNADQHFSYKGGLLLRRQGCIWVGADQAFAD